MDFLEKFLRFSIGGLTIAKLLTAVLILLVCMVIIKIANKAVVSFLQKTKIDKSLHGFIRSIVKLVLWFLTVIIVADSLGIPVTSLLAVFSIAGLAASLAMQDTLSNFASGVLILVTRPFGVGDFIECNGESGVVKSISLVYTQILTVDNKTVFLPNSDVSGGKIVNYTKEEYRRVDVEISASYDCDVDAVKKALLEAVSCVKTVTGEPDVPFVNVMEYGSSSIEYVVRVWCKTPDYWATTFALKEEVKKSFDRNSIEMTYDHLNVHLDK